MRITHNARPWEPACIRSHAGFVWTRPTETSPQTATKGFSSPRRPPNVSPIQFPALPWTSPPTPKNGPFLRKRVYFSNFFSSGNRSSKNFLVPRYRREAVNALVDDPIVGKSEESPRVFPRGENNVAVASLVASFSVCVSRCVFLFLELSQSRRNLASHFYNS